MVELSELFGTGRAMLLIGAVLLYVASRVRSHILAGTEFSPGRRALGNWFPIAAAVLVAVAMRRGDWALSIIFATSVGCLSLLLGSICIMNPGSAAMAHSRRFWPFALPAALMALLAGFAGNLSWRSALALLIEGGALLLAWREISAGESTVREPRNDEAGIFRTINLALCILMAVVGAIAGDFGIGRISRDFSGVADTTTLVAVLSPILILPMLSGAAALARKNRASEAVTSAIAVVLLNICLLLPVAAFLWYAAHAVGGNLSGPLPFGWVTWRVDSVLLVVLSFARLPAALGRWTLGRAEGLALIAVYGVYVLMEAAGSLRS
jgi:Ca2+/Na+ antiporter